MAKVTSKLQVTIPRKVADRYGIEPGAEVDFEPAGDVMRLRVVGRGPRPGALTLDERLRLFDEATDRQRQRDARVLASLEDSGDGRGWTRDDLYDERIGRGVRR